MPTPYPKQLVHRASVLNSGGEVTAICYKSQRKLTDPDSWVLTDTHTTCPACRTLIRAAVNDRIDRRIAGEKAMALYGLRVPRPAIIFHATQ